MKVSASELGNIATIWLDEVLLPKSTPLQTMVIVFAFLQGKDKMINQLKPFLNLDENGAFDFETTKDNANKALSKAGGQFTIPALNYTFDTDDLNKLFEIVRRIAK